VPDYYVYIMASRRLTLYIGMTNDLERRLYEHKNHLLPGFTSKYRVTRFVCFESTTHVLAAISREKQLKGWRRERKMELISSVNPKW
jgi:putative endonuclease